MPRQVHRCEQLVCVDSVADRGRRARRLAEQNYTWDKLARDLHAACERLVA